MINKEYLRNLRSPNRENPLRILTSACLGGIKCGYDGSSYGEHPDVLDIINLSNTNVVSFCPEDFSFGTPRAMCDIHGGDGFDVLDGKAKVLTEHGEDWSEGLIKASEKMLELAQTNNIELAIMMDVSASCGSQVIYDGNRFSENKKYQIGMGVCAAQLKRNGFEVISQRDFASLEILYSKLYPNYKIDQSKLDHNEIEWYREYFEV